MSPILLYVSPQGKDHWSGRLPDPNAEGSDGPLATLAGARNTVRGLKTGGLLSGSVTVILRGGRYFVTDPVVFGPIDSAPVTYASYPGEEAIIDGGRRITGWRKETVDGRAAWVADVPDVASGKWNFRQLFVNGGRRMRPRFPRTGIWRTVSNEEVRWDNIFQGGSSFEFEPGAIRGTWKNLADIDVVLLHWWIEERLPIVSVDEKSNTVVSSLKTRMMIRDEEGGGSKYYVDNVFEAMSEPGDWYLDRPTGRLIYLPMPGENIETAEVYAPVAEQLLRFDGKPDDGKFVEFIRFERLAFEHTERVLPPDSFAAWGQAAHGAIGAIALTGARYCAFEDCRIAHVGGYGIDIGEGCSALRIVGCEVADTGGGGVKLNGADANGPAVRQVHHVRITDCHLHHGGMIFHSAIGVISMNAHDITIMHNHIHDYYYSGVSVGWVWGYTPSVSMNNLVAKNHIHDLGFGWLSDMGGIYTLGVQPGTVLRGNVIHDVTAAKYGGWAIYPDEGSSHIVIEDNVCYRTSSQVFHQHYGRENTVRNNVWAFGREGMAKRSRVETHISFTFTGNIVLSDGQPIWNNSNPDRGAMYVDANLYWDIAGHPPKGSEKLTFEELKALGFDRHSVAADPKFRDWKTGDFSLASDSPAFALGFRAIDTSDVGPRPSEKRD